MRQHLLNDFTAIYHVDLHGNVRQNPKLSGTTHNVFGIQVGVGITIAIRSANSPLRGLYYYRVPEDWRKEEKLDFLKERGNITGIEWQQLEPDEHNTWITEGLRPEFDTFLPIGIRDAKSNRSLEVEVLFKTFSIGANTSRDYWMYDFDPGKLARKAADMTESYNAELSRWVRAGCPENIDDFVITDDTKIKWSSRLKECLARKIEARFYASNIRNSLYRPFTREHLYFDSVMTHRQGRMSFIFPTLASESENQIIVVTDHGYRSGFSTLCTNLIPDYHLIAASDAFQCFPYYVYNEDGSGRRENITDWALARFQAAYGPAVTKRDIFHYVYGALHHPFYRERYAANLKRELPRIPLVAGADAFREVARIGGELSALHLGYEQASEYPLRRVEAAGERIDWRVKEKRMRLNADKTALAYNDWLTLEGIPAEVYRYRLGNRSALEWVIDQYHVSTDSRSGITSDPNRPDDEQYIVRLIGQVVTVSVETVRLVDALARVTLVEVGEADAAAADA